MICYLTLDSTYFEDFSLNPELTSIFVSLIEFYSNDSNPNETLNSKLTQISSSLFNLVKLDEIEYKNSLNESDNEELDFNYLNNLYHRILFLISFINGSARLKSLSSKLATICVYFLLNNFKKENSSSIDHFNVIIFILY